MTTRTQTTFPPPVMEARRWLEGVTFPHNQPLINVSQAAPVDPPPAPLRAAMAEALAAPETHLYGPVLGLPALREELAAQWSTHYGGQVMPSQVAITSGCNQAFAATITALCTQGDEVILPTPWYFNHKMWLDMSGVTAVPLPTGADLIPDANRADWSGRRSIGRACDALPGCCRPQTTTRTWRILWPLPMAPSMSPLPERHRRILSAFFPWCRTGSGWAMSRA